MSLLEREGLLWAKRQQMFGADAEVIWANERAARASKEQAMQAELKQLDQADEITLDEAVFQLESSITEITSKTPQGPLNLRKAMVSSGFIGPGLRSQPGVHDFHTGCQGFDASPQ